MQSKASQLDLTMRSIVDHCRQVVTPPGEEFHARLWAIDDDDNDNVSSDTRPTELITGH